MGAQENVGEGGKAVQGRETREAEKWTAGSSWEGRDRLGERGKQARIFCEQEKTQKYTVLFQFLSCSGPSEQENPG